MRIPEKLSIAITADGVPLEGIPVLLTFVMARKNNHDLVFGPSDKSGDICVSGDQIRSGARKNVEFFLMDYADVESFWTGMLRITPMNRQAVERALSAFRIFRRFKYPPGYEEMLQRADATLKKFPKAKLEARVHIEPPGSFTVEMMAVNVD